MYEKLEPEISRMIQTLHNSLLHWLFLSYVVLRGHLSQTPNCSSFIIGHRLFKT